MRVGASCCRPVAQSAASLVSSGDASSRSRRPRPARHQRRHRPPALAHLSCRRSWPRLHRSLLRLVVGDVVVRVHAVPFGRVDPVLGRDISFYLFRLPMLELLHGIALTTIDPDNRRRRRLARRCWQPGARPVRGVIASRARDGTCRFSPPRSSLVLAFGAWLRIPHLLTEQSGVVFGASYVDVHARMPASGC